MNHPKNYLDYVKNTREPKDIGMTSAREIALGVNFKLELGAKRNSHLWCYRNDAIDSVERWLTDLDVIHNPNFMSFRNFEELYDYVDRNPDVMAAPVDYTNDVRVMAQIDNFISINNAIDMDLFGQVNAESAGTKHISGTGGQLDFAMGAYLSKGGKSFICMSSTVTDKQGNVKSRIVPTLTPGSIATDPRSCTHYIVTEYGMVNMKGLSTWQRAEAAISLAHPDFREQLIKDAEKMGIWRRSNK